MALYCVSFLLFVKFLCITGIVNLFYVHHAMAVIKVSSSMTCEWADQESSNLISRGVDWTVRPWGEIFSSFYLKKLNRFEETKFISPLVLQLCRTKTGKKIWSEFIELSRKHQDVIIDLGDYSRTHAVWKRSFSPQDPWNQSFNEELSVVLGVSSSFREIVLDFAHEISHALYRKTVNPFEFSKKADLELAENLFDFGGEAHALSLECKVFMELKSLSHYGQLSSPWKQQEKRCKVYNDLESNSQHKAGIFSHLPYGHLWPIFLAMKNEEFTAWQELVSSLRDFNSSREVWNKYIQSLGKKPSFLIQSSRGQKSYPLSILEEWISSRQQTCQMEERRLLFWDSILVSKTSPGELQGSDLAKEKNFFFNIWQKHCKL